MIDVFLINLLNYKYLIIGYPFDVEVDKVRDGSDITSEANIRDVV